MRRQIKPQRFAAFGDQSVVVPPAVILSPHRIRIGDGVLIQERAWLSVVEEWYGQTFEPSFTIGNRTTLGRNNYISCIGQVEIGDDVLTGDDVLIADTYHGYRDPDVAIRYQPMAPPEPVRIGDGVALYPRAVVLQGVTIGDRSNIAAGAVVTEDVPPNSLVVGNPGRVVRRYDHEREEWIDTGEAEAR